MKKTSFKEWLIFCMSILFLMIGVHQSMQYGFAASYWAYMICFIFLALYVNIKKKAQDDSTAQTTKPANKKADGKRKK